MEWMTFWCAFCTSMPSESRVICMYSFLHLTVSQICQCPLFLVAHQCLQQPFTQRCVHSPSLHDNYAHTRYSDPLQDWSCTPFHQAAWAHPPGGYSPDQLLATWAMTPDPSLTSCLRDQFWDQCFSFSILSPFHASSTSVVLTAKCFLTIHSFSVLPFLLILVSNRQRCVSNMSWLRSIPTNSDLMMTKLRHWLSVFAPEQVFLWWASQDWW